MEIRTARPEDANVLAATLAQAFDGDPVWSWMLPPGRGRLERLFGALLRHALPRGHVTMTGNGRAVALWSPPEQWRLPAPAVVRAAPHIARAAGYRLPRLLRRLGEIEAHHERQPADHWYLEFIGSAAPGEGLGAALLDDFNKHHEGVAIYLESSNPQNLPFYQRHGFMVTGEVPVRSGPAQTTLWRESGAPVGRSDS